MASLALGRIAELRAPSVLNLPKSFNDAFPKRKARRLLDFLDTMIAVNCGGLDVNQVGREGIPGQTHMPSQFDQRVFGRHFEGRRYRVELDNAITIIALKETCTSMVHYITKLPISEPATSRNDVSKGSPNKAKKARGCRKIAGVGMYIGVRMCAYNQSLHQHLCDSCIAREYLQSQQICLVARSGNRDSYTEPIYPVIWSPLRREQQIAGES
ncbi:hypothetical protein P152DRAFT_210623 [Eremomyces bilateralis CBS 781.70]|uniref:Uncharacterized protein n=1 Tax=Eremomyces bilateralis CBS 781.70 TaxID=1392243 RepID=A0A6G1FSF4_9PEZI|nr:uncharacterized protein P152DRAFT_210623 [Eremomyces bilateralis CBS 781.70]KAF1808666.1 hypothetical protein P152DRAFT_210623 [Eremomyces bilateralis CBS 781.70]